MQLLEKYGAALKVDSDTRDNRECMLCGEKGDGVTEGTARSAILFVVKFVC